ncbi:MAG: 5'-3' exonuclease [Aquificaceae bacterium]|nr:5'-3' exonuclease [Aquificaceae bacterium]MCX7989553.1 5'-3' exonuclease [Aquificaceae bacterium]MDW8294614.1 5'-3' exonuclease H3TH domain-containing protein [Aquificaceae bacterium]
MKVLHLLDGSAFLYRSFFALPPLSTSEGFPTGAIYGFMRALFALLKKEKPTYFAVAFDLPAPTKRESLYEDYKAKRPTMPDPLKVQIPLIKELIDLLGIKRYEVEGYEGDDIIATLSLLALERGFSLRVYSPDKDLLQLVGERLVVINPISGEVFDREKVKEKFGVPPEMLVDYLALVGDKVDNIEGIKGVGPKTAIRLLQHYRSAENILRNWEEFSQAFPEAKRENLELALALLRLHRVEGLQFKEEELRIREPNLRGLEERFEKLQMKSLLKELETFLKVRAQKELF